jgi:diacylglycerol kinase family enzyme
VAAPRSPQQLVETIHRGLAVRADVVAFDGRYAINSLGLGFEGIVNRYSQSMTRLRGTALYLAAVFKALSNLRCPNFELHTAEGRRIAGPHLMISIGNGVRTGGGFYLTPEACADDGLLDLCVVAPLGRARVLALLPKSLRGGHVGHPAVTMLRSERIAVTSEPGLPMHADGELIDPAPARMTLTVLPRTLRVLTTAEHPPHFLHAAERIL